MGHQPKMEEDFSVENVKKYITTKWEHVYLKLNLGWF